VKPARVKLPDGVEVLLIPGVGMALPARDPQGRVLIGEVALATPFGPPIPLRETLDSLEERFGGTPPSRVSI
jgi:hypothetical protein